MFTNPNVVLTLDSLPVTVTERVKKETAAVFNAIAKNEPSVVIEELISKLHESAGSWSTSSAFKERLTLMAYNDVHRLLVIWVKKPSKPVECSGGIIQSGVLNKTRINMSYLIRTIEAVAA